MLIPRVTKPSPLEPLVAVAFVIAVILGVVTDARAGETYLTIGAGTSTLHQLPVDGHWQQSGYDADIDQRANTWSVGIGRDINAHWAIEAALHQLGEYNAVIRFTSDANHNKAGGGCFAPCEPTRTGWQHGDTRGLVLSTLFTPGPARIAPYVRTGVLLFDSTFRSQIVNGTDIYGKQLQTISGDPDSFNKRSAGWLLGIGLRLGDQLALEATHYPRTASGGSAYHAITTIALQVRLK